MVFNEGTQRKLKGQEPQLEYYCERGLGFFFLFNFVFLRNFYFHIISYLQLEFGKDCWFGSSKDTIKITETICQDACMWYALNQVLGLRCDDVTM